MEMFLSCDWGTTSFRLRLISTADLSVVAEQNNDQGIAATYARWQGEGTDREACYAAVVQEALQALIRETGLDMGDVPVILSGMASSSIGLCELPYQTMPFRLDGSDLPVKRLTLKCIANPVVLVSGVRTGSDVMRGEETKVVGCSPGLDDTDEESLIILPGTHPKHVLVRKKAAYAFKTFMTGEVFDLLATRSVLSASVSKSDEWDRAESRESFSRGVMQGSTANILHACFMVRTNQLLQQMPPSQNFYFLSGLLIGSELKDIDPAVPLYIAGSPMHNALYGQACRVLRIPVAREMDADGALIKGQAQLLRKNCV
jgi:2-dehydro-3-deoxygalactonokinase